jgi:1,4-dihydroxy-2-naphthoyl-CoA hydrolase
MDIEVPQTLEEWNAAGAEYLPGHLGFSFVKVEPLEVVAKVTARKALGAWNGYLHAGAVVTLADTCCGYGTVRSLPAGASGFTTIELKKQLLRLGARGRDRLCRASAAPGPYHAGVGRHRHPRGRGQSHRPVPLHANGVVAQGLGGTSLA